ncbi:MAG TPA: cupin domain-containing protein [Euryarchaeota archaeon]|nr:MAG: cupin [Thermoplasmatales archaeon ex4484_6]HHD16862.1 cupin domain-containing protein [Euryarchaeota archaeon]
MNDPGKMNLGEMVEYSEGSIVSRTIIDRNRGTVTLFSFDAGQSLSEHTAPFDAMVHVLEGLARIDISGRSHELSGGEMIIMPANEPHSVTAVEPFKMVLTMIRSE